MAVFFNLLACYILFVTTNEAARILAVFPTPSISHQIVFRPLTQELAKRGHDVTVITTDPAFPKGQTLPANLTEIDVHDISYDLWRKKFVLRSNNDDDMLTQNEIFFDLYVSILDAQLSDEKVKNLINNKEQQFDLLILEACVRPTLGYSHRFKVPVILMSSFGALPYNFETVGIPVHPLLYPSIPRQRINNLSLWEKISELYYYYSNDIYILERYKPIEHKMLIKHFGPETPSIMELNKNVDMIFLNVYQVFEGIRPIPPNVIYMGGLHQNPKRDLPTDLKSYLDTSKNGVIYISFGTNVDPTRLAAEKIQALVKAFSKLPYDVLWKWNGEELPGRTENIRISKWLPQSDLLKHPKVKLFVTQGGLQSTDEAITAGVPLIVMPMLGDQWFNAERYEYHKIGVRIDLDKLTEERFKSAILKVIGDDSYRQNVVKLRSQMYDQVQSPLERAVWWTEYVLRHGGAKHLRSPSAHISWAEYLELKLVLTLLAGLSAIAILFILIVRKIYNYIHIQLATPEKVKRT